LVCGSSDESLALIEHGILKPLLQIASMGGAAAATTNNSESTNNHANNHDNNSNTKLLQHAAVNALQSLLYWTSSAQEITNMAVDQLLQAKAVPRLVELILDFPSPPPTTPNTEPTNPLHRHPSKQIINLALAILVNLTRTEQGAVELVGTTLPEEAIYSSPKSHPDHPESTPSPEPIPDTTRIKPTMELLLDRFLKTTPMTKIPPETSSISDDSSPSDWQEQWYPLDPYQHFAAILMNATQIHSGRQFIMRIPRSKTTTTTTTTTTTRNTYGSIPSTNANNSTTTTTNNNNNNDNDPSGETAAVQQPQQQPPPPQQQQLQPQSVLQRLLSQLKPSSPSIITNPIRRRGISGMIRNCCLERDSAWWLLNVCQVLTPLLLPLAGPEELDWEDKKGLDPDLWIHGPDQRREMDETTRLHCVEAILLLCATGRASRHTLRLAKTYVILKYCDMVEESEDVSDRINDCVQYLRRDEEGTAEGSSDQLVELSSTTTTNQKGKTTHKIAGLLEASPSTQIRATVGKYDDEDYNDVD